MNCRRRSIPSWQEFLLTPRRSSSRKCVPDPAVEDRAAQVGVAQVAPAVLVDLRLTAAAHRRNGEISQGYEGDLGRTGGIGRLSALCVLRNELMDFLLLAHLNLRRARAVAYCDRVFSLTPTFGRHLHREVPRPHDDATDSG